MLNPRIGDVVARKGSNRPELIVDIDPDNTARIVTAWRTEPNDPLSVAEVVRRISSVVLLRRPRRA